MMTEQAADIGTYSEAFEKYASDNSDWIDSYGPLVFAMRKVCEQMDTADALAGEDADLDATGGHTFGRYLRLFDALDKRRPREKAGAGKPADDPAQTDIFAFID